jgi:hypothetical protein
VALKAVSKAMEALIRGKIIRYGSIREITRMKANRLLKSKAD